MIELTDACCYAEATTLCYTIDAGEYGVFEYRCNNFHEAHEYERCWRENIKEFLKEFKEFEPDA